MAIQQKAFTVVEDVLEVQASDAVTGMVGFQVTSFGATLTITFEGTVNGSDWVSLLRREVGVDATPSGTTATANGVFVVDSAGLLKVRARASTVSGGGSANVDAIAQIG